MSEWKKVKLGDVSIIFSGFAFKSKDMNNIGGIPLIKIKNINNFTVSTVCDSYLNTNVELGKYERFKLQPNDFLIAMTGQGSVGRVGKMMDYSPIFYVNQRVAIVRPDVEKVNPYYLYKCLATSEREKELFNKANGAGQPNISPTQIGDLDLVIPNLPTQHRIANILSRYDTLIENYQKQIKLLEEAAQRLYKEWFVELRFPGHENTKMVDGLPEGWERKKLGELVTKSIGGGWGKESPQEKYDKEGFVIRGTDISKLRCGNLDDIPFRYHTESNLKERTLSDGDLIFEVSGGSEKEPVGRMYLITQQILDFYKKDVICASFCKKVAFSNKCTSILCYFAMQYCRISGDMKKYEKDSAGNIINFAWTTFLEDFFVLLPNDEILEAFYKTAIDIINKQVNLALQIRLLTEARDRLLPRLIGGELDVKTQIK